MNRQRASQLAGLGAVAIAAVALIGWWAGLPPLANWDDIALSPPVAVGLMALGLALAYAGRDWRFASGAG
ncbi:MAG: hypothetical protein FWD12_13385, partial [Alphaproteobacteria bacterium]|nr:hypothetical protein [Alphaproteobacteria bacterium]